MIEDLRGEFYHSIDNKSRLSIPRKFAARIEEDDNGRIVVTRGINRCLWLYPLSKFEDLTSQIRSMPSFDPRTQKFQNAFYSGSHDDTLDKAGRILLPKHLLDYAQIVKDIVVVGAMYRIQVWSLDNWNRHVEELTVNADDIASEMSSYIVQNNPQSKGPAL